MPTFDIMFFGDIVGRPGREGVYYFLEHELDDLPDMLMANVENLTHGAGTSEKHYQDMVGHGFHALTGGNHTFDRRDSFGFMNEAERLIRPANIAGSGVPGKGFRIVDVKGQKVGVLNLLGQVYMANYNSPWEVLEDSLPQLLNVTPIVFVDIHAEATAEKGALARYASQLGASVVVGTHTHVQTNDARILHGHTGFLTDAGMNGTYESVIGMDPLAAQHRMTQLGWVKMEVAKNHQIQINAVRFTVDTQTGQCLAVRPIFKILQLPEDISLG
jgi:metallophosphoesterase (TIGR00282 family)